VNRELARLLVEAGVSGDIDWRDTVVLFNYAPVPPPAANAEEANWNRGFNLALLRRGKPTFFCKCRPPGDPVLERETAVRSCLAGHRPDGVSVAPVRAAASSRIAIQVSPFLLGPHYGRIARGQTTSQYLRTLGTALHGAAQLADLALRECAVVSVPSDPIVLSEVAAESLTDAAGLAALDDAQKAALTRAVIEAGAVPARPQHGDFWWQNLLMVDGHLWAIDFDSYGEVLVPLYDDLTLALTTIRLRTSGAVDGFVRLLSSDDDARACRALLTRRALDEGLHPTQLDGVLVYYVTHLASTVNRRGGPVFSAPHVAAVRHAAERLAAGQRGLLDAS
jgi:hypothetical protein